MKKDFDILPHTADIKIRAYGKTLEEFFRNALVGMFKAIGPKIDQSYGAGVSTLPGDFKVEVGRKIELEAIDYEVLLVNFLSEALYLSDVNNEAYLDAKIEKIELCKTHDEIYGQKDDKANYQINYKVSCQEPCQEPFQENFQENCQENFSKVKIKALIFGTPVKGFEVVEIKAVTYNDLKLENIDGVWQSDIVFDI